MVGESRTGYDTARKHLWEIYDAGNGRWRWRAYGEDMKIKKKPDGAFKTEKECEADSKAHGMYGEYEGDCRIESDIFSKSIFVKPHLQNQHDPMMQAYADYLDGLKA